MTLNMTLVGVLLSAIFFLGLLVFLFYRFRKRPKPIAIPASVPLKVDRSALLSEQRRQVTQRRGKLTGSPIDHRIKKGDIPTEKSSVPDTSPPETVEEGFGEDLGAALSLAQQAEVKPKRSQSRFAALQEAADQFKEVYNRNSQL